MKLISLNIWGGKLHKALIDFVHTYKTSVDIFCFQEVYDAPISKIIARGMVSNSFKKISQALPDHKGYFAPHLKGYDIGGKVDFELYSGIAMFIRKSLNVQEVNDIFIFRNKFDVLENEDFVTVPRNLQYARLKRNNEDYLIGHFHGVWFPKTKLDNPERIEQSRKITNFFKGNKGKKVLCGDFNLLPDTESMRIMEKDMRNLITEYHIPTTRNKNYVRTEKHADYMLVSKGVKINEFKTIDKEVSDHLPLYLDFT